MAIDYGRDLAGVADLSFALPEVIDSRLGVAQSIARRLQTDVLFYDPEYGYDLRRLLSAAAVPELGGQVEHRVEQEALKDERVRRARARVTRFAETLDVRLQIATYDEGSFELTLGVSELDVTVLRIE